jgi:hypothetical protein
LAADAPRDARHDGEGEFFPGDARVSLLLERARREVEAVGELARPYAQLGHSVPCEAWPEWGVRA